MTRCKACNEILNKKDDLDPIQELCNPCYDWEEDLPDVLKELGNLDTDWIPVEDY